MPPQKRKTIDSSSRPPSTKRITRSYTKAEALTGPVPTELTQSGTKSTTKPAKAPKATPRSKSAQVKFATTSISPAAKDKQNTKSPNPQPNNSTSPFSTLSIQSTHTKSPTLCNSYSAPSTTSSPTLIFTHGAGGTLSAPAVTHFCTGFSTSSSVLAFQGSMNLASRVKGFHACIEHLVKSIKKRLVLGGRSMGARAAVMAGSEVLEEGGTDLELELVLVSYPLKGPKDTRDQILLDLPASVKILFVVGDRDSMCPLEMLDEVRSKMAAKSKLVIVKGADHGMHVKPAKLEKDIGEHTGRVAADWVASKLTDEVTYLGADE